jgi:thiol-disulfide isomerase/thioredoxin
MARPRTHRRAVAAGATLLLIAVALVIGLAEGGGGSTRPDDVPSLDRARADVAGAPAPLARLYAADAGAADADAGGVRVLDLDRAGVRDLLKGLRGRPVLVNVWYPRCPPCRREFPILRTAAARYGTRMAFLGLATRGSAAEVAAFLREQPTVYPHVRDPGARIARAELEAGVAFPSSVLIDARGEIVDVKAGEYASLGALQDDLRTRLGIGATTAAAPGGAAAPAATTTTEGAAR